MSKYRVKPTPKKQALSVQDIKDEKKFMKVAIIVTIAVIGIIYLVFTFL